MATPNSAPKVGVFDSGFGGLTVLRALLPLIPGAQYLYLGDTARLPYGAKSQQTIARYALSSAAFLLEQGIDLLVVACNTATALALHDLRAALPIPVVGVIQPGAEAAANALGAPSIPPFGSVGSPPQISPALFNPATVLVLATPATVQSAAYTRVCTELGLTIHEKPCPLLVPLVEEGWIDHPVTAEVLRIYLTEALAEAPNATTLILGCTHYPLLKPQIERTLAALHHPMTLIDSAQATAHAAARHLPDTPSHTPITTSFFVTDSQQKFARLGPLFLAQPIPNVTLIDLGG